jgi:hypothetical protein
MMIGREIIFAAIIAGIATSLLLDIFRFASRTLPNFLRRANSINTNQDPMLAMMLDDMQAAGLIGLKPDKEISVAPKAQVGEMPATSRPKTTRQSTHDNMSKNAADVWSAPTRLRC